MTLKEFIRQKVLGIVGLSKDTTPDKEKLTFINDADRLLKTKLKEYNVWYYGDGDELLNFYTRGNMLTFNTEPYYSRNKRNYFWSISSTEADIKRTHSGQPRNIVDTLVMITRYPILTVEGKDTNQLEKWLEMQLADLKWFNDFEKYTFASKVLNKSNLQLLKEHSNQMLMIKIKNKKRKHLTIDRSNFERANVISMRPFRKK